MTTQQPTREQVVKWASEAGMLPISFNRTSMSTEMSAFTPELEAFVNLARADLEATVEVQAAEIERLKADNELLRNLSFRDERDELRQQLAEARLRKDEARNKAAECASGHSRTLEMLAAAHLHIEQLRKAAIHGKMYCPNGSIAEEIINAALRLEINS